MLFKQIVEKYYLWGLENPIGCIPRAVAREGAGENRIPFAHYANSLPVYLIFAGLLKNCKKDKAFILDIGCGTGRSISFVKDNVSKKNYYYYGIDYSQGCIKYARTQYHKQKVSFIQYEGKFLPFPDQSFDFVVSSHVIEHIREEDGAPYLSEIARILKKGGKAIIGTPNRKYCQDLFSINPKDVRQYRFILPHEHEYYYEEIKILLSANKSFKKYIIYGTTNDVNRTLMTEGVKFIKPGKGLYYQLKSKLYSYLRLFPTVQDFMARMGSELLLRRFKLNYKDVMYSTYMTRGSSVDQADNFIIIASC